jgi:lipoprotein-releasing system permease protein
MALGARMDSVVRVINPEGEMTPYGPRPVVKRFRVVGLFDSGFYIYDDRWAFASLREIQRTLGVGDVINAIEFKLDDLAVADEVATKIEELAGEKFGAQSWMEQNRNLFNALKVEKLVTAITIGLIMLVAALNILTALVMIVMEKTKDIAILKSIGARQSQVRRIFMWQGLMIGVVGTALGLVSGHILAWLCQSYRLLPLEAEVYGLSFVPFAPRAVDALLVAVAAILISYVTTLYPSSSAGRIVPVEVLRYE